MNIHEGKVRKKGIIPKTTKNHAKLLASKYQLQDTKSVEKELDDTSYYYYMFCFGFRSVHYIEKLSSLYGVKAPALTPQQVDMSSTRWASNMVGFTSSMQSYKLSSLYGVKAPALTPQQVDMSSTRWASNMVGLLTVCSYNSTPNTQPMLIHHLTKPGSAVGREPAADPGLTSSIWPGPILSWR